MTFRLLVKFSFLFAAVFIVQAYLQGSIFKAEKNERQFNFSDSKDSIDFFLKYGEKFVQSEPDSAWFYYNKAYTAALQNNDKKSVSLYISRAIVLLNNEGKYEKALELGQQMIKIGNETEDTIILIKGYNDAANEYEYLGELQQASENYLIALRFADRLSNKKMQQKLNNNIASVFIELKDYTNANKYADNAYLMAKSDGDTAEIGSSLINLGITEIHLEKFNSALEHFNQAILIGKKINDATLVADAKLNRGIIFSKQNKLTDARKDYEEVNIMANKLKMPDYNLNALFSLSEVEQQVRNYSQAEKYIRQAIAIGEQLGASNELQEMYDSLSVILEKNRNLNGALKYRKKYETLSDSILNARVKTNINLLQIKYKAAKKDKEIVEQDLLLQKNYSTIERKNILLLFSAGGIIILLVLIIITYRFYRQRQKLHNQTVLNFQKEQEVIRLKAMMQGREEERKRISGEMHDDIGAALTTIMYLSNNLSEKKEEDRPKIINKITSTAAAVVDKMNEIIWSLNKEYDTLDDLITYIRYHAVELLENNGINYKIRLPEQVPAVKLNGEKRRNVYLVVKESIHNVIKHAEATQVILEFKMDEGLCIRIQDNGKGIYSNNPSKFGNGMKNMRYRIEYIGGIFSIENQQGTTVNIRLPFEKHLSIN